MINLDVDATNGAKITAMFDGGLQEQEEHLLRWSQGGRREVVCNNNTT